jgi:hypothetical protein
MNARIHVKKTSYQSLGARIARAVTRLGVRVDFLVAGWLQRCAMNADAAQRLFTIGRKPARRFGIGMSLVVPSLGWDESTLT